MSGEDTRLNKVGAENHSEVMLPWSCECPRCGYGCAGRTNVLCVSVRNMLGCTTGSKQRSISVIEVSGRFDCDIASSGSVILEAAANSELMCCYFSLLCK